MINAIPVVFERGGRRYRVLVSSLVGQECRCGGVDWRVDQPPRILNARPVTYPEARDYLNEGHLDVTIEIVCGLCGERTRREVMTDAVDPVG